MRFFLFNVLAPVWWAAIILAPLLGPGVGHASDGFSVSGKALVMGEKIPLNGATVFVVDRDDIDVAITEPDGSFTIALPQEGEYQISASMIGFSQMEPVKIEVTQERP
ncbi:MAG: carboxypeptidase-like regulatory domain-containing protein, partial [Nitrospinota bacterium]|nr:carboxypeptidase-like regulatory domain-containing protein [Nitrospinota bacterium]